LIDAVLARDGDGSFMIRAWLERMGLGQMVRGQIVGGGFWSPFRQRTNTSELGFSNPFRADIIRRMGVKMTPRVVWSGFGYNGITVTGKNHLLDVTFGNSSPVTQVSPWYIGLINNTPTPTLSENDTLASHAGWVEATGYSGTRKAWDDANAALKIKGTTTPSTFNITTTQAIYGIMVASVTSGTGGLLWATGGFDTIANVINGDDLKVTYGIRT
jgi:hypothetical protein